MASLYDDDAAGADRAAAIYRRAIPELPRDGTAYNNLGVIALGRGEVAEAERWFIRALVADPDHRIASRNLARILYVAGTAEKLGASLERLVAAGVSRDLLARISHALVEVARDDAREGIAAKGHELKNILGVLGTRLRRLARDAEGAQGQKLAALHEKLSVVYDEWALYLRTVREEVVAIDTIDLKVLVTEAIRRVGVPVRLDLAAERLEIQGLRGQLIEAVVNLLRNAVEAGGEGAEVRVVTRRVRAAQVVHLDVIDDGDGIPPADLRRVLHAGYTTKRDGSGLGLSISERIVQAHGGRLDIDSRPGEGTRVRVELPLRLESLTRHGMLQAPAARVLGAARAEEYVAEE
ncbi:MAG: ATP-binding protein [Deltaproteobacteria bacterium]|nr:ATP-binding protein [Deltaproteobacteria bacterium]